MGELKIKANMAAVVRNIFNRSSIFAFSLQSNGRSVFCSYKASYRQLQISSNQHEKWDLVSAVCLERFPVLTASPNEIEVKFEDMLKKQELEQSVLCDHELRHKADLETAERRKQDDFEESEAETVLQTAVEAEDEWENELAQFTPASRTTDADHNNDLKSSHRKLDSKLLLLVKQKLGPESHWVAPQGVRQEGESMRDAAERILRTCCGESLQAQFMGNAPSGFYKYKYSKDPPTDGQPVGAKVFYFKAQLKSGDVIKSSPEVEDYLWLTKEELPSYVPASYADNLDKFLLEL